MKKNVLEEIIHKCRKIRNLMLVFSACLIKAYHLKIKAFKRYS